MRFYFGSTVVHVGRICSVKYEDRGSNCLSNAARYPIDYCFSEDFRASSVCFSDENKMLIMIWLEHWWDGADRGRRKYAEQVPLFGPKNSNRLARGQTRAFMERGRRLSQPWHGLYIQKRVKEFFHIQRPPTAERALLCGKFPGLAYLSC